MQNSEKFETISANRKRTLADYVEKKKNVSTV